jgi:hypothetical protein
MMKQHSAKWHEFHRRWTTWSKSTKSVLGSGWMKEWMKRSSWGKEPIAPLFSFGGLRGKFREQPQVYGYMPENKWPSKTAQHFRTCAMAFHNCIIGLPLADSGIPAQISTHVTFTYVVYSKHRHELWACGDVLHKWTWSTVCDESLEGTYSFLVWMRSYTCTWNIVVQVSYSGSQLFHQ